MTIVRMNHLRACGICSAGARDFFKRHGLDWNKFLTDGIEGEVLTATGEAQAVEVVRFAEHGR